MSKKEVIRVVKNNKKTHPPKLRKAMASLYAFLDYVFRIVMLNLLIVVPALLPFLIYSFVVDKNENVSELYGYITLIPTAIYMFPAIVSCVDVLRMHEDNLTKGVFKEFFVSFKKHFLKSFVISVIIFGVLFILLMNFDINNFQVQGPVFYFLNNLQDIPSLFGLALTISFALIGCYILIHIPLVMVYFEGLSLWQYLKLAFIMSFKNVLKTIVILLIVIAFIILDLLLPVVTFILGISLPLYFMVKLSFKEYIKLYRKVEENEKRIEETN